MHSKAFGAVVLALAVAFAGSVRDVLAGAAQDAGPGPLSWLLVVTVIAASQVLWLGREPRPTGEPR